MPLSAYGGPQIPNTPRPSLKAACIGLKKSAPNINVGSPQISFLPLISLNLAKIMRIKFLDILPDLR
jgi:hypothetical protein